ncbi:MAG: hypothetical protein LBQ24_03710 [Candidatus Peribacteria bacterium]|jgi:hypothetical protein|nr:hypothetical protein [Candidatus Peribacteria bacterium]
MGNSEPTTDEIKQIEEIIKDFFPQQNYGNGDSRDIAPIRLVIKSKIRELFRSIENYFSDDRTLENCVLNNYMNKILTLLKYKELLRLDDETVTDLTIKLEKITNKFFHTLQDNTDTEHNNDDIMTVIR